MSNVGGANDVLSNNPLNPISYQAFVTLHPDWLPINSLGAGVANKRQL